MQRSIRVLRDADEKGAALEPLPGLADIPILGHLFRNRRHSNANEELLIFITPRVIKL